MHGHWLKGYLRDGKEIKGGSGGGGTGGDGVLVIRPVKDAGTVISDKTWGEILAAHEAGTPIFVSLENGDYGGYCMYPVFFCGYNDEYGWGLNYYRYDDGERLFVSAEAGTPATDYPVFDDGK